ncbi:MAG: hypothetical protein L0211_00275, partial [Planctomycetaceae bacterium]|nr:hypothetical protein [Planctomycetaceae bacterium]
MAESTSQAAVSDCKLGIANCKLRIAIARSPICNLQCSIRNLQWLLVLPTIFFCSCQTLSRRDSQTPAQAASPEQAQA